MPEGYRFLDERVLAQVRLAQDCVELGGLRLPDEELRSLERCMHLSGYSSETLLAQQPRRSGSPADGSGTMRSSCTLISARIR